MRVHSYPTLSAPAGVRPGRITDLSIVSQDDEAQSVTLQTADMPGSDGFTGDTVVSYRFGFRDQSTGAVVEANWTDPMTILTAWQSSSGMTPGSAQSFYLEIGHSGGYYVAMRVVNADGAESVTSNAVLVTFA